MIKNEKPILLAGGIQLWQMDLSSLDRSGAESWELLSPVEKKRAAGYRFPRDRERFVLRRALLRILLGFYTGQEPEKVQFSVGPFGKPFLDPGPVGGPLHFNLSHSGDVVAYAFSQTCAVGIDIEKVDPGYPWETVAGHCCSEQERQQIRCLPEEQRRRAFYSLWTCKEAWLKLTGQGLSALTDTLRASWLDPDRYLVLSLQLGEDYVGHVISG